MTPDKLAEMRDDEFCASLRATARTMELMGRVSEAREVREAVGRIEAAAQRAERAEAELAALPITISVAGHGTIMARVTTIDNARMLFAGLQATSENGGNFGWVIKDTRPPIIHAPAAEKPVTPDAGGAA